MKCARSDNRMAQHSPLTFDIVEVWMFVARLVMFTWALGTAAPLASVIAPIKLPSVACPNKHAANRQVTIAPETIDLIFMDPPSLLPRQSAGFNSNDSNWKELELIAGQTLVAQALTSTGFNRLFAKDSAKVIGVSRRLTKIFDARFSRGASGTE
jgi:hypothetical protein